MIELPDSIYAGMRVLFKNGHGWEVGELHSATLTDELTFSVINIEGEEIKWITADNIFFNTRFLEPWEQSYVMTKDEFLQKVEDEEIIPQANSAWMSDGEYAYYSVGRWNENWINKQPFEYVLCE